MKKLAVMIAVVSSLGIASVVAARSAEKDIVDTAAGAKDFSTLVSLVKSAGLVETLKGEGPFTVFAPTNTAFGKVPKATLSKLGADKKALTSVLTYHVVAGNVMAADVVKMNGKKVKTVNGGELTVRVSNGRVFLQDGTGARVEVVKTDIRATNGVIHVLGGVLMPGSR